MSTVAQAPGKPEGGNAAPASDWRTLGPWFVAVLLHSYAATLFTTGCYDFADKVLGANASTRLWVSAGWGLAYVCIALWAGRLTERLGGGRTMRVMLPLCIGATLIGTIVLAVPAGRWWGPLLLLAAMLPYNFTASACWPALESAISRCPGRMRLSTRMATYNLAWAITGFAAYFTRGALEKLWWGLVWVGPSITTLAVIAVVWRAAGSREITGPQSVPEEAGGEMELDTPEIRARARTLLHMAWLGNALAYVAINVIVPVMMLLAKSAWEAGTGHEVGLVLAAIVTSAWGFTRVVGFLAVMKWTGWHYKARWLVGAQLALAASFAVILMVHHPAALLLAQGVFGLAAALIYSSSLYYAMHTSDGAGGHAGFHEAVIGLGVCVGPAIGALAGGDALGAAALSRIGWSVTAVLVIGALVMAFMGRKKT